MPFPISAIVAPTTAECGIAVLWLAWHCHTTLFIRSWIERQSDKYAQTNYLLRFLALRIFLILSVPEATLKGISKNCSNSTAVCLTLKIWDPPNTGNHSLFGDKK